MVEVSGCQFSCRPPVSRALRDTILGIACTTVYVFGVLLGSYQNYGYGYENSYHYYYYQPKEIL